MGFLGDLTLQRLLFIVSSLFLLGTVAGLILRFTAKSDKARATVSNMNTRMLTWWVLLAVFALACVFQQTGLIVMFGIFSFVALREFITVTPANPARHRTLFWSLFLFTLLQYVMIALGWYGIFSILIPVYAFLFIPIYYAIAGHTEQFLERTSRIHWGLMICTYCLSYTPALLTLKVPGYPKHPVNLVFYLIIIVEASDILQYVWGKLFGRTPIAPKVSPSKTVEGFVGGILSASAIGTALYWATPFLWWQASIICLITTLVGFAGDLTMSAIKRDRGVKDYGTLIVGHGGVLDRADSLCFAAPVFFHLTRYFFVN